MSIAEPTLRDLMGKLDAIAERLDSPTQRYLSIKQAASYTGMSQDSVRRMLSGGKIRRLNPCPGSVRIDRLELDDFLASTSDGCLVGGRGSWLKENSPAGRLSGNRAGQEKVCNGQSTS